MKSDAPAMVEKAETLEEAIQIMAEVIGVHENNPVKIIKTPVEDVAAQFQYLKHLVEKRGEDRERYANYLLPTLESPFEVGRCSMTMEAPETGISEYSRVCGI